MEFVKFILVIILFSCVKAFAQLPLDPSAFAKWTKVSDPIISDNGRHVAYKIINLTLEGSSICLFSVFDSSSYIFEGGQQPIFTCQGTKFMFLSASTLRIVDLNGSYGVDSITGVLSYKVPTSNVNGWLAYETSSQQKSLIVKNLETGVSFHFNDPKNFIFSPDGNYLIIVQSSKSDSTHDKVRVIDLKKITQNVVVPVTGIVTGIYLDDSSYNVAFAIENKFNALQSHSIELYQLRNLNHRILINDSIVQRRFKNCKLKGGEEVVLSSDGSKFYFRFQDTTHGRVGENSPDIYTSRDSKLLTREIFIQNDYFSSDPGYLAMVKIESGNIIQITGQDENVLHITPLKAGRKYLLIQERAGDESEWNWNVEARPSIFLFNLETGKRVILQKHAKEKNGYFVLSPNEKYVLYYDSHQSNFFTYNISTGAKINITKDISTSWTTSERYDEPLAKFTPIGLASWTTMDSAVLLYDQYDIWKVDPENNLTPINITSNLGKKNKIRFRLLFHSVSIDQNSDILLNSFSTKDKQNGFYYTKMNKNSTPRKLSSGSYIYYLADGYVSNRGMRPIKANNESLFLVQRMSATESPNFFITKDFKTFRQVSHLYPEKDFNWLTSQLISFKTSKGLPGSAVLYKPANFSPSKKYPVLFYFYERLTDELNEYKEPEYSRGRINIPYFVSNGYIVCTIDIEYSLGFPGESAFEYVTSAANYLKTYRWVDGNRLGIQGHSFGGYEVNYIITKTSMFAAAVSAAGVANFMSCYGSLRGDGNSSQWIFEYSQGRMGTTPWTKPRSYIENSPIFFVNKVTTPLLIMHNKNDMASPFQQGLEFFLALRRLGKKAWLLQYHNGTHSVDGEEAIDFTMKMKDFFDYYLMHSKEKSWLLGSSKRTSESKRKELLIDNINLNQTP